MAETVRAPNLQLTAAYRCDRCGGQAYVGVRLKTGGDLYFCAHHYTQNEAKLVQIASKILDHRKELSRA